MNKLKHLFAFVVSILGWTEEKLEGAEKLSFTADDKLKLDAAAKKEGFAEKFEAAFNDALEGDAANKDIIAFMQAQAADDENNNAKKLEVDPNAKVPTLEENVNALITSNKELQGKVIKLTSTREEDIPTAVVEGGAKPVLMATHSKTHLFASTEPFNALTPDRPWNMRVAGLKSTVDIQGATTDWNTINIDKINTDFGAYARKNLDKIVSLMRDGFDIPAHWGIISGVSDEVAFTALLSGKLTQGLKKKWLPKNKNKFVPQIGKIYDVQIDAAWTGYELKSIEKSWLNSFFNNVNSSPYKMSFVEYLVAELLKQARKEDKIGLIKGVYYPNTDMDLPGNFLNAQSGLLKLVDSKKGKEYNPFDLGSPTTANIYDYINNMVAKLPHDIRILPELQLGLSHAWLKGYQDARETAKGTQTDYKGKEITVDGYSNIKFVTLAQLEGSNFMFVTTWDNISVLVDKPGEDSIITFEKAGRDINAFADYKLGIYVSVFGAQMADGNVVGFDNQLFFSNDVEVLQDVYAPVPANIATPNLAYHHSLIIGEHNTAATDITNFLNPIAGKKVYLTGNNDVTPSTVKNNANIILSADCILTTTMLLVLMARSDGKFVELYRTDLTAASDAVALAADATTADAALGVEFITVANTIATAITDITNAVNGETYTLRGGSNTNSTTIANAGNFTLSAAMTLANGTWIELYYNGTKFIESRRG